MTSPAQAAGQRADVFEPLRQALANSDESQRYQLLLSLFSELAEFSPESGSAKSQAAAERVESLNRKLKSASEERAELNDALTVAKADIAHRDRQLAAEQSRSKELQGLLEQQRERFEAARKERDEFETELNLRKSQLHEAETRADDFQLKFERAEKHVHDTGRIEQREEENRKLTEEIGRLQGELKQVRADKDDEIEQLKRQVAETSGGEGAGVEVLLGDLWERLARKKPPLVEGHVKPTVKAAERIVDGFHELTDFATSSEQDVCVVLDEWTKYDDVIKRLWKAYKVSDNLGKLIPATIAPSGNKPISVMVIRLHALKTWSIAVMSAFDVALKSVGPALDEHLRGEEGMGTDANARIRDYLRNSGPDLFGQHMRTLTSAKLAEMYGHWAKVRR